MALTPTLRELVLDLLESALRPLLRLALRHSIKLPEIQSALKRVLVDLAREELAPTERDASVSKISMVTGLHRQEVKRLISEPERSPPPANLVMRVIGQWQHGKEFTTERGKPRTLSFAHSDDEFPRLIKTVSVEPNPYTVLAEMERLGVAARTSKGIKLQSKMLIAPRGEVKTGTAFLAKDLDDLISAVNENIFGSPDLPNLHIRTEYSRIPAEKEGEVRGWLLKEGSAFHKKVREYLSRLDLDITPLPDDKNSECIQVSFGTYSRTIIGSKPQDQG